MYSFWPRTIQSYVFGIWRENLCPITYPDTYFDNKSISENELWNIPTMKNDNASNNVLQSFNKLNLYINSEQKCKPFSVKQIDLPS